MRYALRLTLAALSAALFFSAASYASAPAASPIAVRQDQQREQEKADLYKKFLDNIKGSPEQQKAAYEMGKEFLQKFGGDNDAYSQYVQKWVKSYEKSAREYEFYQAFNKKDYAKTFETGRQVMADSPENFRAAAVLTAAGLALAQAKDNSHNSEAAGYARQALQLIESGKVTDPAPYKTKEDAIARLNFAVGFFIRDASPAEAAETLAKVARSSGDFKNEPTVYYYLGNAIAKKEYEPLSKEYNDKYGGKEATPESTAMLEKLNAVVDRIIDAYARAAALSTKPDQQQFKTDVIMPQLTDIYKFRHNGTDAGLTDLINTVLSKPMPQ